jgi:hypothetical protein
MVARAFYELFVAGCLEVKTREVDGEVQRLYRVVDEIDTTLLGRMERIVVRCLRTFRTFDDLLELCPHEIREELESGAHRQDETAALLAEMGEVIDDALEYLPPACSCSV